MDGADSDRKVNIDLKQYLPDGVSLAGEESQITVTIKVEPLETKDIVLGADAVRQVGASSHYSYQFDRDQITVTIKGLAEDLDQLTEESLEAEVDVSDMQPGTQREHGNGKPGRDRGRKRLCFRAVIAACIMDKTGVKLYGK